MELDQKMAKLDVKYFRYMDDILILAPTRWKLKKAIRVLNQTFNELKLEQHPDKTLIGRVERGFDFLGYHFKFGKLYVAGYTIERFKERIARLYEQGADSVRIGQYVLKWVQWVSAALWPHRHTVFAIIDKARPYTTSVLTCLGIRHALSAFH